MDRDTTVRDEPPSNPAPHRLVLEWVWPHPRSVKLEGARLSLGRDTAAAIPLTGARVSRHHAELYRQGPLYVVHDLGSTNGTWLDGRAVEHAPVKPGSVLRIGDCVGVFVMREEGSTPFAELAPDLFGGPELGRVLAPVQRAAAHDVPVSLVGATGTGKERFARAVHHFSGRSGPFLAVNCAALPEHLAEAELFGYRKGAFTGAERTSSGYFRAADGGTLFLDEVPELSANLQSKLLRVLDDGHVLGLGESRAVPTNVRVVTASQVPLAELVQAQRFRQDLAARLCGLEVRLPPLSARAADIAHLFRIFVSKHAGGRPPEIEGRLIEALCLHPWPENVRELALVTRTLLAVHGHEPVLRREHLPAAIAARCEEHTPGKRASQDRKAHDLARIREELQRSGGNVQATANKLGLSRQRVYRVLGEAGRDGGAPSEEEEAARDADGQ